MPINQFIFDGFLYLTIGAFGIASIDKWITNKQTTPTEEGVDNPDA